MKALARTAAYLQLSRRLDWRFLLPEPQLRRVGYWGPENTTLVQALNIFSPSLHLFSPAQPVAATASVTRVDLAVLVAPTSTQLQAAATKLMAGGCLYAEMPSAWHSLEERRHPSFAESLVGIEGYLAALQRLDFAEVRAYWHRPSFEHCVQIIPLHDERAREFVFSQRTADLRSRLKFATGKSLLKNRWLLRWFQSVSLVACR